MTGLYHRVGLMVYWSDSSPSAESFYSPRRLLVSHASMHALRDSLVGLMRIYCGYIRVVDARYTDQEWDYFMTDDDIRNERWHVLREEHIPSACLPPLQHQTALNAVSSTSVETLPASATSEAVWPLQLSIDPSR